jgi:hypothetical protein
MIYELTSWLIQLHDDLNENSQTLENDNGKSWIL